MKNSKLFYALQVRLILSRKPGVKPFFYGKYLMKEVILYLLVAIASLVVLGYSVHMFVGGLVSESTEWWLISGACLIGLAVIALMAWDVLRRRRRLRTED